MINKHKAFLNIASELAGQSKCISKMVGAIIVKDNCIISSGINGTPAGQKNCCDHFMLEPGSIEKMSTLRELHHIWSAKHETHAEVNAIGKAAKNGISIGGSTCYCTLMPCWNCMILLHATGIRKVYYKHEYDFASDMIEYMEYTNNFDWFERINYE